MAASQVAVLAPLVAPLPDGPSDQFFTDEQWTTLMAIMDAVIPSVRRESRTGNKKFQLTVSDVEYNSAIDHLKKSLVNCPASDTLDEYLDENVSGIPAFQETLKRALVYYTKDDAKRGLALILSALK